MKTQSDPTGISFLIRLIRFIVIICFKVLAFPFRVMIIISIP